MPEPLFEADKKAKINKNKKMRWKGFWFGA